jgi:GNAT superfamily N-acetyltransferase
MREDDLDDVLDVTNAAFTDLVERMSGRRPSDPLFSSLMCRYRLALDHDGCHVAVADGMVVGANFSVLRGTLGWFGPLAVSPEFQGAGIAQQLVAECMRSADARGVTLMGLETLANSSQHIHLYVKLGFRPSWIGVNYHGEARESELPAEIETKSPAPNLDYLYPGFEASKDVVTTRSSAAGVALTYGEGIAVCHTENTLWVDPATAYVPLIVAPDRKTFDVLLRGVEAVAKSQGMTAVSTQVPGSSWATQEALLERGYRPGGAALRMKRGERPDYDSGPAYYCDDWH